MPRPSIKPSVVVWRVSKWKYIVPLIDDENCEIEKRQKTLFPIIKKFIREGTIIYSDCWAAYSDLNPQGYTHATVNHSENFVNQTFTHKILNACGVMLRNTLKKDLACVANTGSNTLPDIHLYNQHQIKSTFSINFLQTTQHTRRQQFLRRR